MIKQTLFNTKRISRVSWATVMVTFPKSNSPLINAKSGTKALLG
jgi:hypothetical protein